MFSMNKYNFNRLFDFDESISDYDFLPLEEMEKSGMEIRIHALYLNKKSMYDDHYIAICDDRHLVSLPAHMNETIGNILADVEAVAAINAGNVGIKARKYTKEIPLRGGKATVTKDCYAVEWVDMPAEK